MPEEQIVFEGQEMVQQFVFVEEYVEKPSACDLICRINRPFQTRNVTILESYPHTSVIVAFKKSSVHTTASITQVLSGCNPITVTTAIPDKVQALPCRKYLVFSGSDYHIMKKR